MCAESLLFTVLDVLRMQNQASLAGASKLKCLPSIAMFWGPWNDAWVAGHFKDLVLLSKAYPEMVCLKSHSFLRVYMRILYIRKMFWSRFTDGFIYSKHAACYTWGTCSLPLSLMEQSLVHVRIRLNGREPCRFLKQQTPGSPSTFKRPTQNCPPFDFFLNATFDFQRNKNHLPNHRFSGGPWSFLVGIPSLNTEFLPTEEVI